MSVDPSHFLAASNDGKPPLLKLINIAARPELNNQFGQAISYSAGRYVVAVLDGATVAAAAATTNNTTNNANNGTFVKLKPENLIEATNIDQLRFGLNMIYTTFKAYITNVELHNYYGSLIITKLIPRAIQQKLAVSPQNALFITCGIVLSLIILCSIILGNLLGSYHRLFILASLVVLFITITSPDWTAGYRSNEPIDRICKACITNFHQRWKDNLINITGYTYITNNVAWAVLFGVLLVAGKSLLATPTTSNTTPSLSSSSYGGLNVPQQQQQHQQHRQSIDIEYFYKLGYDDAKAGNDYQTSLPKDILSSKYSNPVTMSIETPADDDMKEDVDQYYDNDYNTNWRPPPPPIKRSSSFGMGTVMSAFTIYKFGKDIVTTPTGQLILDVRVMVHKLKGVEPWRLGLLAMSLYRVVLALRSFFF
jgi:hypothetical protein